QAELHAIFAHKHAKSPYDGQYGIHSGMGTSALEIGADIGKKLIFDIVDEDEKNFVLGLEMSENSAFGHARLLRQEDGGRIAEAPFGEQPGRRAQYGVS